MTRIGIGYDVHKLVPDRELWLGGVHIPHLFGLDGHSDADVLLHAICDAMLGAAALGDIGQHFPDTDERYRGISSSLLLGNVYALIKQRGYVVSNVDSIVVAQRPKLMEYIPAMRESIATVLCINKDMVSVKATTTERLGFEGREEGISAFATVLIIDKDTN